VSIKTVAFCGLGTMGAGMVRNLMTAGFSVTGWNRTPSRAEPLRGEGMNVADSPREAATGCDAVMLCVSDDDAVREVALDLDSGALAGIGEGSLVIDCSTTGPSLTRELADEVRERGGSFIDAPITGSKLGAEGGKLTYMVGGATADVERARPIFEATGKHFVHVGEQVGQGQAAKYCLNMTQAIVLEGVLEGYALAKRQGVPIEKMSEIFENSAGKTGVGSFKTPYLQAGDYTPHFKLWLMHKDLHLALSEASRFRLPLPLARAVCTLYDQGVAEGMGDEDFLVLARLLERWGNVQLRDGDGESA
jgi:3-hydroxyisobutyrate dehydrogenase-like beta-hydroxyacid dehydrogenase